VAKGQAGAFPWQGLRQRVLRARRLARESVLLEGLQSLVRQEPD
jgi:hypothetical protein